MWQDGAASKALSIVPVQPTNREEALPVYQSLSWSHAQSGIERAAAWGWTTLKPGPKPRGIRQAQVQEARWNLCSQQQEHDQVKNCRSVLLFSFFTLIYSSFATHDKDFLKRNQKRSQTSVECPLSNTTFWRRFPFKRILLIFSDLKDAISMIKPFGIWDF